MRLSTLSVSDRLHRRPRAVKPRSQYTSALRCFGGRHIIDRHFWTSLVTSCVLAVIVWSPEDEVVRQGSVEQNA